MSVLAELDDEHARPPALAAGEGLDLALDPAIVVVALVDRTIDAGDRVDGRAMAREDLLESVGDLADRGADACRVDGERQQIALPAPRRLGQRVERDPDALGVAGLADLRQPRDLLLAHPGVVDVENVDRRSRRPSGIC